MPSYTIYLSRHGESLANVGGVIGGDASLSQRGSAYAARLCQYIESETPHDSPVWTSLPFVARCKPCGRWSTTCLAVGTQSRRYNTPLLRAPFDIRWSLGLSTFVQG